MAAAGSMPHLHESPLAPSPRSGRACQSCDQEDFGRADRGEPTECRHQKRTSAFAGYLHLMIADPPRSQLPRYARLFVPRHLFCVTYAGGAPGLVRWFETRYLSSSCCELRLRRRKNCRPRTQFARNLVRFPADRVAPRTLAALTRSSFVFLPRLAQQFADSQLRLVQLRLRIPYRAIEQFGDFLVFVPFNFVQQENGPIAVGQFLNGAGQRDAVHAPR